MDRIQRKIVFSASEVNERLILDGEPVIARLLPKNHPPVEGKVPYPQLLCQKLASVTPSGSTYVMKDKFKINKAGICRNYVACTLHNVVSPVWFIQASLQQDQPLEILMKQMCVRCNKREHQLQESIMEAVPTPSPEPVAAGPVNAAASVNAAAPVIATAPVIAAAPVIALPSITAANEIAPIFEGVSTAIGNVLMHAYHKCSVAENPKHAVEINWHQIEMKVGEAIRHYGQNTFPVREEIVMNEVEAAVSEPEPAAEPVPVVEEPDSNAFKVIMSRKAQQKVKEQEAKVRAKKQRQN